MADKVADAENQDVLSSIRRLVSDDPAPGSGAHSDRAGKERLLLTPALRVLPKDEQPAEEHVPILPVGKSGDEAQSAPAQGSLEATVATLETAVEGDAAFEPDGGEASTVLDYPPSLIQGAMAGEDGPRRRLHFGPAPDRGDPAPIGTIEAADLSPAPQGSRPLDRVGNLRLVPQAEDLGEHAEPEPEAEAGEEIAIARSEAEDLTGAVSGDEGQGDIDEVLLDEDDLRSMVAQMVREELQGTLGAQITGNIRKLIRREIHDYFDVRDDE